MLRYSKLIITLSLSFTGDILFTLALIWRVLSLDGSPKLLGLFLCLITILTFVLQKFSGGFRRILEVSPKRSFMWIRILGVLFALIFLPLLWNEKIWFLYIAGMLSTIINFLSTITMEAIIAQEVLDKKLSSNKAARILQVITLSSSFLGAATLGLVLSFGNMKCVLIVNIITYLVGALYYIFERNMDANYSLFNANLNTKKHEIIIKTNYSVLWLAFIGLIFLMIQISAFNFLVPLIAKNERMWTASQFGFIDAAAEFGGFLASFIILERGWLSKAWVLTFSAILCVDILFFAIHNAYIISFATLFLGFFVSAFRVKQRELIYDSISGTNEILEWTGRITAMTTIIKALAPMSLAFIALNPSYDLILIGIFVSIGMIVTQAILLYVSKRCVKKTQEDLIVA